MAADAKRSMNTSRRQRSDQAALARMLRPSGQPIAASPPDLSWHEIEETPQGSAYLARKSGKIELALAWSADGDDHAYFAQTADGKLFE